MRVYKFGGASIATAGRMVDLLPIVKKVNEPLVLVVSAIGKTTNALEAIAALACDNQKEKALEAAKALGQQHIDYACALLDSARWPLMQEQLGLYLAELDQAIINADPERADYNYDQIICLGELFSTLIFSLYLKQAGKENVWIDARTIIKADSTFRDANVDLEASTRLVNATIGSLLKEGKTVITQGFIGSDDQGHSVTLGREGSDYSAALFASMLSLESVTIWKDVEGLLNADPKQFKDTRKIETISYNEVIEMAFYGAQIIHPKTIKPLQNSHIPLYVKCFSNPALPGTVIHDEHADIIYPPLIALKEHQVLLQVTTRDFSFINENNLSALYAIFHSLNVKINLIQNAAISFVACIDNKKERVAALVQALNKDYKVLINEELSLLTIRHFDAEIFGKLTQGKQILLKQETRKTIQVVMS